MWKSTNASTENKTPQATIASSADSRPNTPLRDGSLAAPQQATIGKSLLIQGEITGSEPLCIEGSVEGSISLPGNRVTVGREGKVKASISAREIVVIGSVCGNLNGNGVDIRSQGSVTGDVLTQRIRIQDGAFFKGSIDICKPDQKGDREAQVEPIVGTEAVKVSSTAAATPLPVI